MILLADVPVALKQQHAWYMVNTRDAWEEQVQQIHSRVDWLFDAGFDGLATESGLSEFTHPTCQVMLDLLNEVATYAKNAYGREAVVKVHCSTGQVNRCLSSPDCWSDFLAAARRRSLTTDRAAQTCPDYEDPRTGEPLNFNFLPTYADPALGVMPHTVQAYAVDDPSAGSYGNDNFTYMMDYMFYEAHQGVRTVVWHPETAYWVNVDVDGASCCPRVFCDSLFHRQQLTCCSAPACALHVSPALPAHLRPAPPARPAHPRQARDRREREDRWPGRLDIVWPISDTIDARLR